VLTRVAKIRQKIKMLVNSAYMGQDPLHQSNELNHQI
jgi:hypothetical protein